MFRKLFPRTEPKYAAIGGSEAAAMHGQPDTVFVDVREPDEIARTGTVKGAVRAPLAGLANFARPDGSGAFPAAGGAHRIVLVCASGARSGIAARELAGLGYSQLFNVKGGFGVYSAAGGPIER